ncbi:MAG: signal peptide peptidase SppA [Candidatus Eisenbacteria bacterium]|nr:signal peptide peptidase SppA [Candidatus Eisenbacteria bacterium]
MASRGCLWGWIIGVAALLLIVLVTVVTIESVLGERISLPMPGRHVGLIRIEGLLADPTRIISDIDELTDDPSIGAVVLRIDSPGGGVAASQEVYSRIVEARDDGTPFVVSMGTVAASGGYYVACPAESILANPGTLTGSIGVVLSFMNFEELFGKIGVDMEVVKSGRYKDTGSWSRQMTDEERALLQETIDDIHRQFVETVILERGLEPARVESLADGRVLSGRQALGAGLVDRLGTLDDALAVAGRLAGIEGEPNVRRPVRPRRLTLLDLVGSTLGSLADESPAKAGAQYLWYPGK